MKLEEIRKNIDSIDHEILKLLNERMELALRTKKYKETIVDVQREKEVLKKLENFSRSCHLIRGGFVDKLFGVIIEECRKSQEKNRCLIGFQGEHGAFGEMAANNYDPSFVPIPCVQFADIFEGVERGELDMGIVPVENSLGGAVTQVNELLINTELKVVAAVKLRINHCLLTLPESDYQEIRVVYSHPLALSQCREFINRHHLEARPFYDTAGAARWLAKEKPKMTATIASRLCAELYNLEVIKENIEDQQVNFTRFLVLARKGEEENGDKCSIIFSTPHKAGTLFSVLKIFAKESINLTRIESFPCRDDPGNYVFFLDFLKKDKGQDIEKILSEVKQKTAMLKYLGCYSEEVYP